MTIGELRKIISKMPSEIRIGISINDIIVSPCLDQSGIDIITDFATNEDEMVLILHPCKHITHTEELYVNKDEINLN